MSSSSMHCTLNIYQLIYMISVIMHCLFPLQSSESCKTMQVSAIYISISFEDTFFFSGVLTNMQSSNIFKSEYQRFLSRNHPKILSKPIPAQYEPLINKQSSHLLYKITDFTGHHDLKTLKISVPIIPS